VSTSILEKRDQLLAQLQDLPEELRWDWLIERARSMPPLPEDQRTEEHRVPGCLSNLWIVPSFVDGRCRYRCDADSVVVKSVAGLLCEFYSDEPPSEILALNPSFLREAGITAHLTSHRRNALTRVWALIRGFAARHVQEF
jgi:cysteine desulfuration protein SufE